MRDCLEGALKDWAILLRFLSGLGTDTVPGPFYFGRLFSAVLTLFRRAQGGALDMDKPESDTDKASSDDEEV